MRGSGILLNISSLPSDFGIGGFGEEIVKFTDFLTECDCKWWQVLPMTTIGLGNSPYSGVSAFAGNYLYIDPILLKDKNLLTNEQVEELKYKGSPHTVDYAFCYNSKRKAIEMVYQKLINTSSDELYMFMDEEREWLLDYATFMTLKKINDNKPWYEWPEEYKRKDEKAICDLLKKYSYDIGYYICEQYLFQTQWLARKKQINEKGIKIIGDMPIYVSYDSVDVWANPELFDLNSDLVPNKVAGVPPDYFCKDGQLWGNPIYNIAKMKKTNFAWFSDRMARMFRLYDRVRMDHFRAFDRYWAVDYGDETAKNGSWKKGFGKEFFKVLKQRFPKADIIAEDLGDIDDGVIALRDYTGYPGMRVFQFGIDSVHSPHLPHNYIKNTVAYTGTHDNTTMYDWFATLSVEKLKKISDYIGVNSNLEGGENSAHIWASIRVLMLSVADTVIIPFQDLAGWGADTRMNTPGKAYDNWRVRITYDAINKIRSDKFRKLNYLSGRSNL